MTIQINDFSCYFKEQERDGQAGGVCPEDYQYIFKAREDCFTFYYVFDIGCELSLVEFKEYFKQFQQWFINTLHESAIEDANCTGYYNYGEVYV